MKKTVKRKNVISLVCLLAFLISIINLNTFTYAKSGLNSDSVTYITKAITVDTTDTKNLLLGGSLDVNLIKDGVNTWENSTNKNSVFGNFGSWDTAEDSCKAWGLLNDTSSTNAYWQVEIKLSASASNLNEFIYYSHDSTSAASRHYAIFMSSDKSTLYNNANKVVEVIEESTSVKRLGDDIDLTKTGKTFTNISYVGIRFYHAYWHNKGGCPIIHNKMLALYSSDEVVTKPESVSYISKAITVDPNDENNRFFNSSIDVKLMKDGANTWENSTNKNNLFASFGAWDTTEDGCNAWELLNDISSTNAYRQIDISLKEAVNDPERFVYYAHDTDKVASRHYAVFMSSNKATLYDDDNMVVEVVGIDPTAARLGDEIDLTKTGKTLKNISYVGIRFYQAAYHYKGGCPIIHNKMLALYGGTVIKPSEERVAIQKLSEVNTSGTNYLEKGNCTGGFYVDGERTLEYANYRINGGLNAWHNENSNACYTKGQPNDTTQTDTYWQMQIGFSGNLSDPETFVFLAHDSSVAVMSQHYALFAASTLTSLYNEENKVIEVTDTTARIGDKIDLSKVGKSLKDVRFFGIRFYHRGYTNSFGCQGQHIYLLGVYGGTYKEDDYEVHNYNSASAYGATTQLGKDIANIGDDFIKGRKPYAVLVNGSATSYTRPMGSVTDGKFDSHLDYAAYKGQNGTCDFIYKVDDDPDVIRRVEKFIFMGHSHTAEWADQYLIGKYEVYAAVNYTELFNADHKIYDYDWERDGITRFHTVSFNDEIYARYVAVRFINPVTTCLDVTYQYPRITEIAFLGDIVNIDDEEVVISKDMPLEVYSEDSNGNKIDVSKDITTEEYNIMFDGKTDASVKFTTSGANIDFVINLLKDYSLTSAVAKTVSNAEYSVYAANRFSDLWLDSSKISTNAFSNALGSAKFRYIRFSFDTSSNKSISIQDLEVKGFANPLISLSEHLGMTVDSSKVSSFENPVGNTDIDNIVYLTNSFNLTFNGDILREEAKLTTGGEVGKSTLNILVKLSALQNIRSYSVSFPPNLMRYQPTKMNVYFGETFEDAMDLSRTPDKTFNGLPPSGSYTSEIKPTLARYIRIEFVDNTYGKTNTEDDGSDSFLLRSADENVFSKKKMEFALSEIDIVGTPVQGMSDENGSLLSFEQDGYKWNVMALDENDVPSNIYSSKIISSTVTNKQKSSMYIAPYYKIVDNKAYEIEFYDFFGKKIDNIGGRDIRLTFPIDSNNTWILGNASDSSKISLYDVTVQDNTITVQDKYTNGLKVSLLVLTDENDPYWKTIIEESGSVSSSNSTSNESTSADYSLSLPDDYISVDGSDLDLSETELIEAEPKLVTTGTEIKHSIVYPGVPTYLIILIIIESILFLAGIGAILFIQFKKPGKPKEL